MKRILEVITPLHKKTPRDYLGRMADDKIECMKVAKQYGREYWDGQRKYGYGGYRYDGRQEAVAKQLIEIYGLNDNSAILDVGCGKGYLFYEFKKLLPGCKIKGIDASEYAIENAKPEVRPYLSLRRAQDTGCFKDKEFDLVVSITTLHNLAVRDLKTALQGIERIGRDKYIAVESFRNEAELFNLECWALTCQAFFSAQDWIWLFKEFNYTGDYEFIYFE